MKTMNHANRITRKPVKPETQWNPDDRVCLGPAAEPVGPFVPCDALLVIPGQKPQGFPTNQEAAEAAYTFVEAHPGTWVEVYGRLSDSPGWILIELIGIPFIDATFGVAAPGWIQRVNVDADSCRT